MNAVPLPFLQEEYMIETAPALSPFDALKLAAITSEIPDAKVHSLMLDFEIQSEDQIHEILGFLSKHRPAIVGELARILGIPAASS